MTNNKPAPTDTPEHTLGPWMITNKGPIRASYQHQIGTNEKTIAYTWLPSNPADAIPLSSDEHEANAALIARAPLMASNIVSLEKTIVRRETDLDRSTEYRIALEKKLIAAEKRILALSEKLAYADELKAEMLAVLVEIEGDAGMCTSTNWSDLRALIAKAEDKS